MLVLFGLPEVPAFRGKLHGWLDTPERRRMLDTVGEIAGQTRSYIGTTALTSLLTGVISAAWAYAIGLDLAMTWGVLTFSLNFVPVVGNVLGTLPPTLYAAIQFGGWTVPLIVFAGYAVIQVGISTFVYPWLQGRGLSLSPAAIILALTLWGWMWGVAGTLLAVPLTAALIIICGQFPASAWIARLLSQR